MISKATSETLAKVEHGRIVVSVLKSLGYMTAMVDSTLVDDLISAGLMGLTLAKEKFDPSLNVAFSTFLFRKVRNSMLDELRKPRKLNGRVLKRRVRIMNKVEDVLFSRIEREPSERSISTVMSLKRTDYDKLRVVRIIESDKTLHQRYIVDPDKVPDKSSLTDRYAEISLAKRKLEQLLGELTQDQRKVIRLVDLEGYTFAETAEILGLTRKSTYTLRSTALKKLRRIVYKKSS